MADSTSRFYLTAGKRIVDLALTILLLPVAVPAAIAVALAVRLGLGSPVLFTQERTGKDGERFTLVKFRTMRDLLQTDDEPAGDAERLTTLGALLRRTSLDELPELLHVITGRMSLVGPRPLLPRYLPRYSARQGRRHEVRPGLTGLAQVRGRNALTWEEKLELDVVYVDNLRFALDLSILLQTAWAVLKGRGVAASGHATMPEFLGTPSETSPEENE